MARAQSSNRWLWLLAPLLACGAAFALWPRSHGAGPASRPAASASRSAPVSEPVEVPKYTLAGPDSGPSGSGLRTEIPWGEEGLGRGTSEDGYPGGPNSFTIGPDGSTWVLDQFHHRMVRLGPDGKILETRATKLQSPADLALGKDGTMAVIDRTKQHQVELFDAQGRSRGVLALPDAVPGQPSELTRVFVEKDKVFAQRGEGGPLIPLGGVDGKAQTGAELNGQPSRDGTLLISAGITDYDTGRVWVSGADPASGKHLFTREATLQNPVAQILLFDSDVTGMIYLVLQAVFDDQGSASTLVLCLDGPARGRIAGMFSLPYPAEPLDTFRKFDVAPEGGLLAAEYTDTGVAYRMHTCR